MTRKEKERYLEKSKYIIQHLAVETWKRLPLAYKSCIDIDDLVQDAKLHVWFEVIPYYQKTRQTQITTFVYSRLKQHLINRTLYYRAQKRKPKDMPQTATVMVHAFESFQLYETLYALSSSQLQQFLGASIGVPKQIKECPKKLKRFRLTGQKWSAVREEFLEVLDVLTRTYGRFTLDDAEILQQLGADLLVQNTQEV